MLNYNPENSPEQTWRWFEELCRNPKRTQESILKDILQNANRSEIAKKYDFSSISSIKEYQKRVPISSWEDYEEYSCRMQNCEKDILFNGSAKIFMQTSGTSGRPKLIPESTLSIEAKSITDKLRQYFMLYPFAKETNIKIFPLANSISLGKTSCGIPYGTASGLTFANVPKHLAEMFVYPAEVLQVDDSEAMDYLLMLFALSNSVSFIVGNNIAKMDKLTSIAKEYAKELCDDIENATINEKLDIEPKIREILLKKLTPNPKRADELREIYKNSDFIPKNYWKDLKVICCWLSGSVGVSVKNIRDLFSKSVAYIDYGYGASEGKFNIPRIPENSQGVLTLHSAFYEFTPLNDKDRFLLAHELEAGELYNLYITNFAGLFRYNMKDIIKVDSFYEATPEIVFVSKSGDIGNIQGEKLAGSTISVAVQKILAKTDLTLQHVGAYPQNTPPCYILYIETKEESEIDSLYLAEQIDKELQNDLGYKNKRRDGLLKPLKVCMMKQGWLESLYREKESAGINRSQLKIPVILKEKLQIKKGKK
jgi:hypothetical protein